MSEVVAVLRLLRAAEMTLGSACDAAASARWAARVEGAGTSGGQLEGDGR